MTIEGLLVLDKPQGMTSRAAVDHALRWFPRRTKLGHTGTLDPLATGVLVVCVGRATRLVEYVQQMSKTYQSIFTLGAISATDDADGPLTPLNARDPGEAAVRAELAKLVGTLQQVPPTYSAAHVAGQRAYDRVRRGQTVQLEARPVQVYGITLLRYAYPEVEVRVECGKGTYIRSLARDLGAALGVGAYVSMLRRTRVGPFTPEQATPLDAVVPRLLPAWLALAQLPRGCIAPQDQERLRQGQAVAVQGDEAQHAAIWCEETLVAIGRIQGGRVWPTKVLL
ncbi:MAG: tRNA pseudouridine(55) synthase TruB [Gemmataceae bacterium]